MQIYAINGSPRKKWNTTQILEKVLEGAAEAEDNVLTEMINLYDYDYKGCIECFQCKRIGGASYGKCVVKDEIQPLIENVIQADIIVFGSPIYFSDVTGIMRCFLERLLFPLFVYDKNYTSLAPKKIATGFFYTMNVTKEMLKTFHYPERLSVMENFIQKIFGKRLRKQYICNTLQFPDYAKYKNEVFNAEEKERYHKINFPQDCKKAYEIGQALVADANGEPLTTFD